MVYPFNRWRGKPLIVGKHASQNIIDLDISFKQIMDVLEDGVETGEKRKEGVYEFIKGFKDKMLKVVVSDAKENWFIITVAQFKR